MTPQAAAIVATRDMILDEAQALDNMPGALTAIVHALALLIMRGQPRHRWAAALPMISDQLRGCFSGPPANRGEDWPFMADVPIDAVQAAARVAEDLKPHLAGLHPAVQGAALAQLVALHLAGHRVSDRAERDRMRATLLALFGDTVRELVPLADAELDGRGAP